MELVGWIHLCRVLFLRRGYRQPDNWRQSVLHVAQISSGFQVAIDHGLDRAANYGSVKAALQNYVMFCREKRAAHRVEFTFDDATAAIRAPTTSTSALSNRCEVAGPSY